jgi:hypothetical protein
VSAKRCVNAMGRQRYEDMLRELVAVSAQYLDTGRGDLDGVIDKARRVLAESEQKRCWVCGHESAGWPYVSSIGARACPKCLERAEFDPRGFNRRSAT